ncbi:phosphoglycerate kinase [Candidatus Finniella inopinata]|uniref:Phosphoglycerate kinase n=2 Tax=Candidatus Finniella inopinata TaxID=1696036 RepID=A0A4Q7DHA5_9PROT|nr:phosphoglycerate kinase [Candidatus Finniella inopinata]
MTSLPTLINQDLSGKTVLVRVDLNVPMHDGVVTDTSRLVAIRNTVTYLLEHQAKVMLLSHFGRPKASRNESEWDLKYSLKSLVKPLEQALDCSVQFVNHYAGLRVQDALSTLPPKTVVLLENVRFAPGEEDNNLYLAAQLAEHANLYVNEAFSCSHRAHASIEAITHYLPSVAGFHFEREVRYLTKCLGNPRRPLMAIIGGSKVSTKLELLENLCQKVDILIIGGAMANTFLAAQGVNIGDSLYEPDLLPTATKILKMDKKATIVLPDDVVTAADLKDSKGTAQSVNSVVKGQKIFDIGPKTSEKIASVLKRAETIIWNGPVGAFEYPAFAQGTISVAKAMADCTGQALTVAGGGDTLSALKLANVTDKLNYVSTAGGAFLEWLEGKKLPGLEALEKAKQQALTI